MKANIPNGQKPEIRIKSGRVRYKRENSTSDIDGFNVADVNPKELCPLLLFGDQNLGTVANRIILEATISFVKASARLN